MATRESQDKFSWIELGAETPDGFRRNVYAHVDSADIDAWRSRHDNRNVFASICCFATADRKGDFCCRFFLDVDVPGDLALARTSMLEACSLLHERLEIPVECFDLYFSGHKGFHLLLPPSVFGDPPGPEAMGVWHALACKLAKLGVEGIDLGVYQSSRLWRLTNSIHGATGLCKVPVEHAELQDLGLGHVLEIARQPREFDSGAVVRECPKAAHWFANISRQFPRHERSAKDRHPPGRHGWRTPPCVRRVEKAVLPDGMRHELYFALSRFYAVTGMAQEEAIARLVEIDRKHPVKDRDYLRRAVESGWKFPGLSQCQRSYLRHFCSPETCFLRRDGPCGPLSGPRRRRTRPQDRKDPIMSNEHKKPVKAFRAGTIEASVWRSEDTTDGQTRVRHSIRIHKRYRDADGNWQDTDYFYVDELPRLQLVARKAYEFIALKDDQE